MADSSRRRVWVHAFDEERRERAKAAFTTRRVPLSAMQTIIGGSVRPRSGDLVLASVKRLGQHRRIERPDGRRAGLHLGDEVLVVYGDRYAPDQFESEVPMNLGVTQLVASGGIASRMLSRSMDVRAATDIMPIGLVGDDRGRPLNIADFALVPALIIPEKRPRCIAVLGTSMNSGKTTTIHYLVRGLSRAGARPGATKVTGTGSGGDYWVMVDAGAHRMLDFTDAGLASTYRQPMSVVERTFTQLVDHLAEAGSGVILVEVADGIYQRETAQLIESPIFKSTVDAVIFAAADAMGAAAGVAHLRSIGHTVLAISGRISRSPLATREAEAVTGLPVLSIVELADAPTAVQLLGLSPTLLQDSPRVAIAARPHAAPALDGVDTGLLGPMEDLDDDQVFVASHEVGAMDRVDVAEPA